MTGKEIINCDKEFLLLNKTSLLVCSLTVFVDSC